MAKKLKIKDEVSASSFLLYIPLKFFTFPPKIIDERQNFSAHRSGRVAEELKSLAGYVQLAIGYVKSVVGYVPGRIRYVFERLRIRPGTSRIRPLTYPTGDLTYKYTFGDVSDTSVDVSDG